MPYLSEYKINAYIESIAKFYNAKLHFDGTMYLQISVTGIFRLCQSTIQGMEAASKSQYI